MKKNAEFSKLNLKQQTFVMEYAADMDVVRAAREAGYKGTDHVVRTTGNKMLAQPRFKTALSEVLAPKLTQENLTVEAILQQLARFLFYNVAQFCDAEGYITVPLSELPEEVQQCVESVEVDKRYGAEGELVSEKTRLKLVSKIKSLELAMKYRKLVSGDTTNVDARQFNFWGNFFDAPPPVIEERITRELESDSGNVSNA